MRAYQTKIKNVVLGIFVCLFMAGCNWYTLPGEEDIYTASQADIDILLAARELLSDESKWTQNEEQQCDLNATQWTLFCALQKASFDVTGDFKLRRAALEETRLAAEEIGGQPFERRLLDFNNMPTTTFEDIQKVLDIALQRIRVRVAES